MKSVFNVFGIAIGFTSICFSVSVPALAQQVRSDNSLSTSVSTSDNLNFTINAGDRVGNSLFHSFEEFSVPTGGSAVFTNSVDIDYIFNRVTGDSLSTIDGLIQANGTADLFLINPNGLVFGSDAQLDIGGSFAGSTAESVRFAGSAEFAATNTLPPSLLTVSAPIGLQLGSSSQDILVQDTGYATFSTLPLTVDSSSGLRVGVGRTIALIGRSVALEGGVVAAPAGHIELGGVGAGVVALDMDNWRFDYENAAQFGAVTLADQSLVNASDLLYGPTGQPFAFGPQGGSIQIRGQQLSVQEDSKVLIQNFGNGPSGSIYLDVEDSIRLTEDGVYSSTATASILTQNFGQGRGGDIGISARQLRLVGGVNLGADTFGNAPGGNVTIAASELIQVTPDSSVRRAFGNIQTVAYGVEKAGDIDISTRRLAILGDGVASLSQGSGVTSRTVGPGAGGSIRVIADSIVLRNGGAISSATLGAGAGGDVLVSADTIDVVGVAPISVLPSIISASATNTGDAGDVTIATRELQIREGGRLDSSTLAFGDAGTVTITATERVNVSGTVPGSINPSLIISSANLVDPGLRAFFASQQSPLPAVPTGDSGDVTISTPSLFVSEGAQVTARNDGLGDGGTLTINADAVYLDSAAGLTASTKVGSGGNLTLNLQDVLLLRQNSVLSAEAGGMGHGGNITLEVPVLFALENSDIIANAVEGTGGNISIDTQGILGISLRDELTPESDITASSQFGVSGTVRIISLQADPDSGLTTLPDERVDASEQVAPACDASQGNQFVVTGRGGLPSDPFRALDSTEPWIDFRGLSNLHELTTADEAATENLIDSAEKPFILSEATDWKLNDRGEIALTAVDEDTVDLIAGRCLTD